MAYITPELFDFFRELAENNEREWFNDNKKRFQLVVQEPLLAFIDAFRPHLLSLSPHYRAIAKKSGGSLFRIYRDTRFSKDARPYKTNAGVHFRHEAGKDAHAPGFYLHLEPGQIFMGGGLWRPPTPVAYDIRQAIADSPTKWGKIVNSPAFAEAFTFGGESLKRPPRGFDKDHPLIDDLKRKDFIASRSFTEEETCAEGFLEQFTGACRAVSPLCGFLTQAVGLPY